MKGEIRTYRSVHNIERFRFFNVTVFESDLHIGVDVASFDPSLTEFVTCEIERIRETLNKYNRLNGTFFSSLTSLKLDDSAETEIRSMLNAGLLANVGPMAAVAGLTSETVGHSLSFGKADAVVICAHDAAIADAFATAVCNIVKTESDIDKALEFTSQFKEILSTVIVINDKIAVSGEFEIVTVG